MDTVDIAIVARRRSLDFVPDQSDVYTRNVREV